jgi:hypothetical protein
VQVCGIGPDEVGKLVRADLAMVTDELTATKRKLLTFAGFVCV